jgi:DNA repair protein RadC
MLPREKYLQKGIDNLSDMELIAILVGSGIKGRDFLSVSRNIVSMMRKSASKKKSIELNDMVNIDGVGIVTAMKILCGIELGRRMYDIGSSEKSIVRNSEDAYRILRDISQKKQEYVVALFLNSRFEVLERRTICIGSLDSVSVLPRDVIIPALELNCSSVVLAHNHPSGDSTPSSEDILITKRIEQGLSLVGLNLLDHIVIAGKEWRRVEV